MIVTTAEQRVRELRHCHVRAAIAHLVSGQSALALLTMLACLDAQARISGLGS